MAIKMRNNNNPEAVCCDCNASADNSLNMFDICIGGEIHTLCDECVRKVSSKVITAIVSVNGRLKSNRDLAIISKRNPRVWKE